MSYTDTGLQPARAALLIHRLSEETAAGAQRLEAFEWCAARMQGGRAMAVETALANCRREHPDWFLVLKPLPLLPR